MNMILQYSVGRNSLKATTVIDIEHILMHVCIYYFVHTIHILSTKK